MNYSITGKDGDSVFVSKISAKTKDEAVKLYLAKKPKHKIIDSAEYVGGDNWEPETSCIISTAKVSS